FPTILLITTLYRLALNVSSTRLILLQADAGEVIRSFGEFVVQGNFVVGAVMFLILTLIQFIVISKGSERVAEVAARFTLDAMPGKQMAIDADLRSGHINQEEARRMRSLLQRESQLYGSMDGAMKFVKGDAVAGILITVINVVGGLVIGVVMKGMAAGEAFKLYSILTIGDGLVSQIPALLISTAAGLVVTRVASEEEGAHLGQDIGGQLLAQPKAIKMAGVLLIALALVPGLPTVPFLVLGLASGAVAWSLERRGGPSESSAVRQAGDRRASGRNEQGRAQALPCGGSEDTLEALAPVALEVAEDLANATGVEPAGGVFITATVPGLRRSLYSDLGVVLPPVKVRRVRSASAGFWCMRLTEIPIAEGVIPIDRLLAAETPERLEVLGITATAPASHPTTNLPAAWVGSDQAATLKQAGIPAIDPPGVLARIVAAVLRRHAHELVGIQETQSLLRQLDSAYPTLVQEVVPKIVSTPLLADVLRRLVEEQVSIRNLRAILGALADWGRAEKDPVLLTEYVRAALKRQITFRYSLGASTLAVFLLDPQIEDAIRGAITKTQTGSYLALEPELSRDILRAIRRALSERMASQRPPVILTSMEIRRFVRRLVEIEHRDVGVLSYQELVPDLNVQPVGRIAVD
ncbi:MAG: type III secretion system export apparatus subunit SctV, partial [Pseudomonadota bacterium]